MIDPRRVGIGDYVVAIDNIHDYGKPGDIYRLIDSRIPDEETSALGWKLNTKTGLLETDRDSKPAYKLPHDKIAPCDRSELSKALKPLLAKVQEEREAVDRRYRVVKDRIEGLINHKSKEEEVESIMRRTFYWMDV